MRHIREGMGEEQIREEVERVVGVYQRECFCEDWGITDFKDSIFFRDKN
jgi:hypothetical protein